MPDETKLLFIGNIIEDIAAAVARNVAHDLRPDAIIAKEFPESTMLLSEIEPANVVNKLFTELRKGF